MRHVCLKYCPYFRDICARCCMQCVSYERNCITLPRLISSMGLVGGGNGSEWRADNVKQCTFMLLWRRVEHGCEKQSVIPRPSRCTRVGQKTFAPLPKSQRFRSFFMSKRIKSVVFACGTRWITPTRLA